MTDLEKLWPLAWYSEDGVEADRKSALGGLWLKWRDLLKTGIAEDACEKGKCCFERSSSLSVVTFSYDSDHQLREDMLQLCSTKNLLNIILGGTTWVHQWVWQSIFIYITFALALTSMPAIVRKLLKLLCQEAFLQLAPFHNGGGTVSKT